MTETWESGPGIESDEFEPVSRWVEKGATPELYPLPNVPLLRKVREHIESHPEEWRQQAWRTRANACTTAFCFAGWAVEIEGAKWYNGYTVSMPDGKDQHVAEAAAQVLGLTPWESNNLFSESNSLTKIDCYLERIYARAERMEALS